MSYLYKFSLCPLALVFSSIAVTASAASYIDLGHAAGKQCASLAINNSGITVGNCAKASATAINSPWVADASTNGGQLSLAPMIAGQPCASMGIANSGKIVGVCTEGGDTSFGVSWEATSPSNAPKKLLPLPATLLIPLLRPADVWTRPTAMNHRGGIVGSSFNGKGDGTVVLYAATGTGTPQRVSDWGDNCSAPAVNITLLNSYPSIAMNCLNDNGNTTATIAIRNTPSSYSKTELPKPVGASYCEVNSINDQSQVVGTCYFPDPGNNVPKTAFWSSPTNSPSVLTLPLNAKNMAVDLNNLGHVLAIRGDNDGMAQVLFWDPATGSQGVRPIVPPDGAVSTIPVSLADNDTVALNSTDSSEYPAGCFWTPADGTSCLTPINGGKKSQLTTISQNGSYVGGIANDSAQSLSAVAADLP